MTDTKDSVCGRSSSSMSSGASTDSFEMLSGVGDDWEALSAAPSETGATVLSDDEEGTDGVNLRAMAHTSSRDVSFSPYSVTSPSNTFDTIPWFSSGDTPKPRALNDSPSDSANVEQNDGLPSPATMTIPVRPTSSPASEEIFVQQQLESRDAAQSVHPVTSTPLNAEVSLHHPSIPPREHRIWMHTSRALPGGVVAKAPFVDADGLPVMVGSALIDGEVHPCKVTLSRLGDAGFTPVRMAYRGKETVHFGVYEVLEVDDDTMEWVSARNGRLPRGRAPIEGGYDREGRRLYYAVTTIKGCTVPGETSEHDNAHFAYGGRVHVKRDDYAILCWRPQYYVPEITQDPWDVEHAPFTDSGGQAPVHVVSVPYGKTLQPGKATLYPDAVRVRIPYLWREIEVDWTANERPLHVLHIDLDAMEWMSTSLGRIPIGVQPVDGGFDKNGERFYHATCVFNGNIVPGKTGEHLRGARFPWNAIEHSIECEYKILCWKPNSSPSSHTSLVPPPPTLLLSDAITPASRILNALTPDGMYVGLAHHPDGSRHPGTVVRGSLERMLYTHGGRALIGSSGVYDLLVYEEAKMEWVPTREGRIPIGRRTVEAGYERNGKKLSFARYLQAAPYIFGKAAEHLQSAHFVRDGQELKVREGYDILCWRDV